MERGREEQNPRMTGDAVRVLPPVIGTYSGGSFNVLDPRPSDVRLIDIAHSLAHICRYTGHTSQLWSVAAHCLEVSDRLGRLGCTFTEQLQGLVHDASEAYLVDLPRPLKQNVWPEYRAIEARVEAAICVALDVPRPFSSIVHTVDDIMVYAEVANFFPPNTFMWERYGIKKERHNLRAYSPAETAQRYIETFEELSHLAGRYEQ